MLVFCLVAILTNDQVSSQIISIGLHKRVATKYTLEAFYGKLLAINSALVAQLDRAAVS